MKKENCQTPPFIKLGMKYPLLVTSDMIKQSKNPLLLS